MTTCEIVLNFIISSITGVSASFLIWYITVKIIVPKLRIGPHICKTISNENNSGAKYRFKFENYGHRNIIDVEVIVRLRIQGLDNSIPNNWEIVYLPTSTLDYVKLSIIRPVSKSKIRGILEIKTYECKFFQDRKFPQYIIDMSINKTLTLEHVMSIREKTELQILFIGTDEFSSAKKFFESKVYKLNDIVQGRFYSKGLNVIPLK